VRLVVALGGNALLKRGQPLTPENQLGNIRLAASQLARIAEGNQLVVTHGNGPQVGLLALQSAAYDAADAFPLDVLGAQTDGMIGYLLEQELSNRLPTSRVVATLLTRVEVDPQDPAFQHPSKPIGPIYAEQQASEIEQARHWTVGRDGSCMRRLVASPQPKRVLGLESIRLLLEHGALVIAAGGGGIPVALDTDGRSLRGVDAVIDKDLCSGLLARQLEADCLVIATDVESVFLDWGLPQQRALKKVTPQSLSSHVFPQGSMGPKVQAACDFVLATGRRAVIGSLAHIDDMLAGAAGTQVCMDGGNV
jgi:carbamate kinase